MRDDRQSMHPPARRFAVAGWDRLCLALGVLLLVAAGWWTPRPVPSASDMTALEIELVGQELRRLNAEHADARYHAGKLGDAPAGLERRWGPAPFDAATVALARECRLVDASRPCGMRQADAKAITAHAESYAVANEQYLRALITDFEREQRELRRELEAQRLAELRARSWAGWIPSLVAAALGGLALLFGVVLGRRRVQLYPAHLEFGGARIDRLDIHGASATPSGVRLLTRSGRAIDLRVPRHERDAVLAELAEWLPSLEERREEARARSAMVRGLAEVRKPANETSTT